MHDSIVAALKEPTLQRVIPALWVPLLSTPPFPPCAPPFLFLFPSEVSEEKQLQFETLSLSLPQTHNVGYVKAVTAADWSSHRI